MKIEGKVCVWDPRVKEAVAVVEPLPGQVGRDCWAVSFGNSCNDERVLCAGYVIIIWC